MNISSLGLLKKSGKLIVGFDAVCSEMENPKSKAAGILVAADVSEKTLKELNFRAEKAHSKLPIKIISADMDSVGRILGKRTGIIAVADEGFFKALTAE